MQPHATHLAVGVAATGHRPRACRQVLLGRGPFGGRVRCLPQRMARAAPPQQDMRITDFKIGTRLAVGFATMLVIMSAITGIAIWRLSRVADLTRQTLQVPLEKDRLASD